MKSLTDVEITLDNWQSTIRHFVSAHSVYAAITEWHGTETADITYFDHTNRLESTLTANVLGDVFPDWLPTWLKDECRCKEGDSSCPSRSCPIRETAVEPLKWLFEVKATTGPCETDLFMTPGQYERVGAPIYGQACKYCTNIHSSRCESLVLSKTTVERRCTALYASTTFSRTTSASDSTLIRGASEEAG